MQFQSVPKNETAGQSDKLAAGAWGRFELVTESPISTLAHLDANMENFGWLTRAFHQPVKEAGPDCNFG